MHVEIEAKAGPAIAVLMPMVQAANAECSLSTSALYPAASAAAPLSFASTPSSDDLVASPNHNMIPAEDQVEAGLVVVASALRAMQATLSRMGEKCDPYIYYHRVRLPMSGWRSNPALPEVWRSNPAEVLLFWGPDSFLCFWTNIVTCCDWNESSISWWLCRPLPYTPRGIRGFCMKASAIAPSSYMGRLGPSRASSPPLTRHWALSTRRIGEWVEHFEAFLSYVLIIDCVGTQAQGLPRRNGRPYAARAQVGLAHHFIWSSMTESSKGIFISHP